MPDGGEPGVQVPTEALLVVSGRAAETLIPIPADGLMLGRRASAAGRLGGDPALSRRHARIRRGPTGGWTIEDLRSSNGTFVNGTPVVGPRPIAVGDVVFAGGTSLQVVDSADPGDDTSTRTRPPVAVSGPPAVAATDAPADVVAGPPAVATSDPPADDGQWQWWKGDQAQTQAPAPPGPGSSPSPAPAAAPGPRPTVGRGRRRGPASPGWRRGQATVEGQVRGLQQRSDTYGEHGARAVWTFRIERYDAAGNRLPPVPVQMRALAFDGALSDNDTARVTGRWKDGTLQCERVENLTTYATVKARSYKAVWVAMAIVLVVMVSGFAWFVLRTTSSVDDDRDRTHEEFCRESEEIGVSPPGC